MTHAEWLMLTLAVYFHDLGMVVTKDEYENREKTLFKEYKENIESENRISAYREYAFASDDHFLYQEFVRENHAKRIKVWLDGNQNIDL